jgi:nitroreductase
MADKVRPDGNPWDKAIVYYNAGLASAQIVFEAEAMGLKAHYMGGIVHDELEQILQLSDVYVVNVIAVGLQADATAASPELQEREAAPRTRKPLEEIILHGLGH